MTLNNPPSHPSQPRLRLAQGHPEQLYQVVLVEGSDIVERRLTAMGFVQGCRVRLIKRTLGRQTLAVSVDGISMLLRTEEAAGIFVFPLHPGDT